MKTFRQFACVFFSLTFAAWLGRAEMHTDDTGILVGMVAVGGFLVSLLDSRVDPRNPWVWGVVVPSGIIGVNLWRHAGIGLLAIAAVTIAAGCAGAYLGAFIRRSLPTT